MPALKLRKTYSKYPDYKDSGIDWLGKIPGNWSFEKVKFISNERNSQSTLVSSGLRFFGLENIESETGKYLSGQEDLIPESSVNIFKKGDVLFGKLRPYLAKVYVAESDGAATGELLDLIPDKRKVSSRYLFYSLLNREFINTVNNSTFGSKMPRANWNFIGNQIIPFPTINQQNEITSELDLQTRLIDQIIEKKKILIDLLKEKRTAIINHAVTKGLDPNAQMVDSGIDWIGKVPEGWRVMPFKYCVEFQEGPGIMASDFRDSGTSLLRVRNLTPGEVSLSNCNFLDPQKVNTVWRHFLLKEGDLLISASATMGIVSEVGKNAEGAIAYTGIIRLTSNEEKTDKNFIKFFVISKPYNSQIDVLHSGTAMQHYGPTHLKKVTGFFPPVNIQIKIGNYLVLQSKEYDDAIKKVEGSIKLLNEFKMSLISNAVTGKIKI